MTAIAFIVGCVVGFIAGYFLNAKQSAKSNPTPLKDADVVGGGYTGGGPGEGTGGGTH